MCGFPGIRVEKRLWRVRWLPGALGRESEFRIGSRVSRGKLRRAQEASMWNGCEASSGRAQPIIARALRLLAGLGIWDWGLGIYRYTGERGSVSGATNCRWVSVCGYRDRGSGGMCAAFSGFGAGVVGTVQSSRDGRVSVDGTVGWLAVDDAGSWYGEFGLGASSRKEVGLVVCCDSVFRQCLWRSGQLLRHWGRAAERETESQQ